MAPAPATATAAAYAALQHDRVRDVFERRFFAALIPGLLAEAGGGRVLDLGCADGLVARLAGAALTDYTGIDMQREPDGFPGAYVEHDLRDGLGRIDGGPADLYLGTFGVASHLEPAALGRLFADIGRHARPGSIVALEALGLSSLEWPRLWDTRPGAERELPYRLTGEVRVHPWAPDELGALLAAAGIRPLRAIDRTLQAGPKCGEIRGWPGLPRIRSALNGLLADDTGAAEQLAAPLPPLPAGPAAVVHHELAAARRRVIGEHRHLPEALARRLWALEPRSGGGFGHGLVVIGRVT